MKAREIFIHIAPGTYLFLLQPIGFGVRKVGEPYLPAYSIRFGCLALIFPRKTNRKP